MSPEAQRIAIAEACGYKGCTDGKCAYRKAQHLHDGLGRIFFPEPYSTSRYPDYLSDLNAMHEAEKTLFPVEVSQLYEKDRPDKWAEYRHRLELMCVGHPGTSLRATAAQRAEAFLKTIGKWTE